MAATITVRAHGREVTTVETPLLVEEAARLVVAGQPDRALVRPLPSERWLYTLRVLERLRCAPAFTCSAPAIGLHGWVCCATRGRGCVGGGARPPAVPMAAGSGLRRWGLGGGGGGDAGRMAATKGGGWCAGDNAAAAMLGVVQCSPDLDLWDGHDACGYCENGHLMGVMSVPCRNATHLDEGLGEGATAICDGAPMRGGVHRAEFTVRHTHHMAPGGGAAGPGGGGGGGGGGRSALAVGVVREGHDPGAGGCDSPAVSGRFSVGRCTPIRCRHALRAGGWGLCAMVTWIG
jgi:hypothetical protein